MSDQVYLEDLVAGQTFTSGTVHLTAEAIKAFAREFDPQEFHLDETAADASLFQGLSASGWHTAALTMRMLVTSGPRVAWGFIGLGGEVSWPRPARVGDTLRLRGEITAIRPSRSKPDRGIISVHCETLNQRDEVVQDMVCQVLVPRRPGSGA
ncbi:MAG: MaoC family dehydratase [Pseudomonadota bacterium]